MDRAHGLGLAVILDVVYNHLGPDGAVHREFAPDYFSARYANEWGGAINFDGANAGPVREFFIANAGSAPGRICHRCASRCTGCPAPSPSTAR